jgi:CspA family cold shock protein
MDDPMGAASQPELQNIEGIVKWFDPRKGFGFLVGPQGEDIFVHYSVIQGEGFKVLKDGAYVTYDAARSGKGWKATRCIRSERVPEITVVIKKGEASRVGKGS